MPSRHTSAKKQRTKKIDKPRQGKRERAQPTGRNPITHKETFWTIKLRNFRSRVRGGPRPIRSFQIYLVREAVYTVWGNFSTSRVEDDRNA
jgi:hypothetical protein